MCTPAIMDPAGIFKSAPQIADPLGLSRTRVGDPLGLMKSTWAESDAVNKPKDATTGATTQTATSAAQAPKYAGAATAGNAAGASASAGSTLLTGPGGVQLDPNQLARNALALGGNTLLGA
ncbi:MULTISPECIES: hypothetical protein [Cupriavidus]|uniref:hypothetical protein n=1 Tax=Cupriavidus TaxID=106589 RepID=UPI000B0FEBAF|nr:hypothetical protein [Cupriavidus basilensis]